MISLLKVPTVARSYGEISGTIRGSKEGRKDVNSLIFVWNCGGVEGLLRLCTPSSKSFFARVCVGTKVPPVFFQGPLTLPLSPSYKTLVFGMRLTTQRLEWGSEAFGLVQLRSSIGDRAI
jgi:hypothetical protein